jgi:hypothetical protein
VPFNIGISPWPAPGQLALLLVSRLSDGSSYAFLRPSSELYRVGEYPKLYRNGPLHMAHSLILFAVASMVLGAWQISSSSPAAGSITSRHTNGLKHA